MPAVTGDLRVLGQGILLLHSKTHPGVRRQIQEEELEKYMAAGLWRLGQDLAALVFTDTTLSHTYNSLL